MKKWRFWIGVLFSAAGLVLAVRGVDSRGLMAVLGGVEIIWLAPALGLVALAMVARAYRWRLLFFPLAGLPLVRLFNLLNIGYLINSLLPLRLGDLVRTYLCAELERLELVRVLSTVVVERVIDTLTILALLLVVVPYVALPTDLSRAALAVGVVAIAAIAVLAYIAASGGQSAVWFDRLGKQVAFLRRPGIRQKVMSALSGLSALRSGTSVLGALLWSLGAWLCTALEFYVVMKAMNLSLPFLAALLAVCLSTLGMVVPSSPGHLGVFEYLTVVALSLFGIGQEAALVFALLVHAVGYLAPVVLGGIAIWREGYSYAQLREAMAQADATGV
jgi:uncharacterized protein (TIRG00374 family)